MGYDLHITRADDWSDNDGAEITAAEWLALVEADPELTLAPELGEHFARWSGPSRHAEPWLDWSGGNIFTKYPDSALLRKMVALADRLGARVQGDDGEWYAGDEPLDEQLDEQLASAGFRDPPRDAERRDAGGRDAERPSWWRRLLGR